MKKTFRKVLSVALAAVVALTTFVVAPKTVKAADVVELTLLNDGQVRAEGNVYRVNIFSSWTNDANDILTDASSFNGATKVEVTFTVSGLGTKSGKAGINMSNGDWGDVQYWFDERTSVTATDVQVTADGTYTVALETTGEYKFDTVAFMDLQTDIASDEGEKDLDITSGIDIKIDKILVTGGTDVPAPGVEPKPQVEPFKADGTYNAYFGLQSPSWTYRDPWNSANGIGSENWGQWVINNDTQQTYGVVTDAEIKGNGTYTVSLKDIGNVFADEFANNADGLDYFRILMITTNIPKEGAENVKITDAKMILDGKTVKTYADAIIDADDEDYFKILLQNEWNPDMKETLPFYTAPTKTIELQFTISGFSYDNAEQATTEAPTTVAKDEDNKDKNDPMPIVIVVVVVVVIVAIVAIVLGNKKKAK